MAAPSLTYTLSNGSTADASQVMQNFNDLLNGYTDGTKDLTCNKITLTTTINKVTITAPATSATLTIANGKTLTASNTLTFTGTDSTSFAFPSSSDTVVTLAASQTLTNKTLTSPIMTAPTLGVATCTSLNGLTVTTSTGTLTITNAKTLSVSNTLTFTGTDSSSVAFGAGGTVVYTSNTLAVHAATTSAQLAGVISDETGSGSLVFGTTPTIATPVITGIVDGTATGFGISTGTGNVYGTISTINDDVATSFTPTKSIGMIMIYGRADAYKDAIFGIYSYRCDATSFVQLISTAGSAMAATTGVLAGTTGTDTKFTVSAHTDNKIYFENRTGSTVSIHYQVLGQ